MISAGIQDFEAFGVLRSGREKDGFYLFAIEQNHYAAIGIHRIRSAENREIVGQYAASLWRDGGQI